ncbi:MAG: carboxymuconolactone decarboxylase family protein [Planctomycetota bacterium]|nr:carboxymuconolactone decarboxylase family protein [Planctomycetota bacterium]
MHHDASSFYESWPATMNAMKAMPGGWDIGKAFAPFFQGIMKDTAAEGGLSAKHKELVALGVGVSSRCEPCIYAHVEKCLKAGATPREVMDAAGVAVMMGGGPVYTYVPVVAAALRHWEAAAR